MRVLIVSQYYYPEGVPKPHELAEELRARGHEVSVITGFPHYPGGKLKDGYRLSLLKRETINNIPVLRTFEIPYHSTNPFLRMANYFSFMLSAPFAAFLTAKVDAIYVWHPPLTVGVAAWIVGKIKRAPFVYDVQDIWPDSVVWSGMMREASAQVKVMRLLERFVYKRARRIVVQTEAGRANLIGKGVAPDKIAVLQNWVDESLFAGDAARRRAEIRAQFGWTNKFVVLFAGNLGLLQGLETAIEAAAQFETDNIRVCFVGDGTDKPRLERLASDAATNGRVQFVERQPMENMPALMAAADVLLVHLKKSKVSNYVVPSKTIAYLASGKPILMATGGASEDLIKAAKAGIAIEPENPAKLAEAIEQMRRMSDAELAQFGANGKKYLHENLSKSSLIAEYAALLQQVVDERRK